jgi:hypothetical protein
MCFYCAYCSYYEPGVLFLLYRSVAYTSIENRVSYHNTTRSEGEHHEQVLGMTKYENKKGRVGEKKTECVGGDRKTCDVDGSMNIW